MDDGVIPLLYRLQETESDGFRRRTKRNVLESDVTRLLSVGPLVGGTFATWQFTQQFAKPHLIIDLVAVGDDVESRFAAWVEAHSIRKLNVAGPGEKRTPGVYGSAFSLLGRLLRTQTTGTP